MVWERKTREWVCVGTGGERTEGILVLIVGCERAVKVQRVREPEEGEEPRRCCRARPPHQRVEAGSRLVPMVHYHRRGRA